MGYSLRTFPLDIQTSNPIFMIKYFWFLTHPANFPRVLSLLKRKKGRKAGVRQQKIKARLNGISEKELGTDINILIRETYFVQ